MTYKEIEKIAKKYGWTTTSAATLYRIEKEYGDTTNYIVIGKFNRNVIFLKNERCNPGDLIVIKAAFKLAETPIKEREEEKKYYLKHSFMCGFEKDTFLNVDDLNRAVYLGSNVQSSSIQTQFTQAEIEDIKEKYKTTLDDFEQIEVEEWTIDRLK